MDPQIPPLALPPASHGTLGTSLPPPPPNEGVVPEDPRASCAVATPVGVKVDRKGALKEVREAGGAREARGGYWLIWSFSFFLFFLSFFFFYGCAHSMRKFLGQGLNLSCSFEQHYSCANARSFNPL